jgi:dolichol-phosphate mannosyltransferase
VPLGLIVAAVRAGREASILKAVVILPTLNERASIAQIISAVLEQDGCLPGLGIHVLVVDWSSTDGTLEYVSNLSHEDERVHVISVGHPGLGVALVKAYSHASAELYADILVQMDADLSHKPSHLPEFFAALRDGYDLAIGSRYIVGGGTVNWPISRRALSGGANWLIRALTGEWGLREWTSGYRAFTTDLYRRLDIDAISYRDYTLQPALVHAALLAGARIKEVPIVFVNRRWGRSKLPMFRYTWNLTRHFLLARWRKLSNSTTTRIIRRRLPD